MCCHSGVIRMERHVGRRAEAEIHNGEKGDRVTGRYAKSEPRSTELG